jgi:hypothetical protein
LFLRWNLASAKFHLRDRKKDQKGRIEACKLHIATPTLIRVGVPISLKRDRRYRWKLYAFAYLFLAELLKTSPEKLFSLARQVEVPQVKKSNNFFVCRER